MRVWLRSLLSRPSLLYLDEVTSGLDELTDRQLMELFQSIANDGKTVVCVTHNLVNIEPTSELIVVLAEGGKLAFVGRPQEAKEYFGIHQLGDVYGALAAQRPAVWKQRFHDSPYFQQYVASRIPAEERSPPLEGDSTRERLTAWLSENRRQSRILLQRSLEVLRADPRSLGVVLLQSLLVAMLLILLFGDISDPQLDSSRDSVWRALAVATAAPGAVISDEQKANKTADHAAKLLFLMAVSCFWFGCNNSAREIVAQRDLFRHERSFNLEPLAYMVSQFAVLGILSIAQSWLLVFLVRSSCGLPGGFISQTLMLSVCTLSGVALGLLISALSRTESMAIACVPVLLIPQIILGGLLAQVSGLASLLAHGAITSFWSFRGLSATLPDDIREKAAALEVIMSADASFLGSVLVVFAHGFVAFALAVAVVHRDGRRSVK